MKKKILLLVLLLAVCNLIAILVYSRNVTVSYRELMNSSITNAVKYQMEKMGKDITTIESRGINIKHSGDTVFRLKDASLASKSVVETVASLSYVAGSGLFFEPYSVIPEQKYFGFYAYDHHGNVIISNVDDSKKPYPEQVWYTYAKKEFMKGANTVWTPAYYDIFDNRHIAMTTYALAIRDANGKFVGMATVDWYLDDMFKTCATLKPTPKSSVVLGSIEQNYALITDQDNQTNIKKWDDLPVKLKKEPQKDEITINEGERIKHFMYTSFSTVLENGMVLLIRIPRWEIYAKVELQNILVLFTIILFTSAILVMTWLMLSNFLIKPLLKLNEQTQLIGKGNFEEDINISNKDEIGQLASSFNLMVQNLREYMRRNSAKSQFLSNMSKQIKTPMNSILGFIQLLKCTNLNEEQADYLNEIQNSSKTLLSMLNDIQDLSTIEFGKMKLQDVKFDFKSMIDSVESFAQVSSLEKHLKITVSADDRIPQKLIGDLTKLKQVLNNLISNAIKFTNKGEIKVNARFLELVNNKVKIEFMVQDTGIGISEEDCKKIFQSYSQADSTSIGASQGAGLGLAISKNIIELMNGKIQVESELEHGSTFTFTVELGVAEMPKSQENKAKSSFDNPAIREIVGKVKETFGFEEDAAKEVVSKFFEELTTQMVGLKYAIENEDFEKIKQLAKSIKASAQNLGIVDLVNISDLLEKSADSKNLATCVKALKELTFFVSRVFAV